MYQLTDERQIRSRFGKFHLKFGYRLLLILTLSIFVGEFVFPQYTIAKTGTLIGGGDFAVHLPEEMNTTLITLVKDYARKEEEIDLVSGVLPEEATFAEPRWTIWVSATAYSSTLDQTDATPFYTATGAHVRDGIVAANFLHFGTRIRFPELFGDKVFVVQDRMNPRFYKKVDFWMPTREQAKQFGMKYVKMEAF